MASIPLLPDASLHLLCVAHFPQMTWDKATNLAAVARGGACSASGKWLILRTCRMMWCGGRGSKSLYGGFTWEKGERTVKTTSTWQANPIHPTNIGYLHHCYQCHNQNAEYVAVNSQNDINIPMLLYVIVQWIKSSQLNSPSPSTQWLSLCYVPLLTIPTTLSWNIFFGKARV